MSERERGGPFPNALEHLEAQRLGRFPTWSSWKHQVEERFGSQWSDGCPSAEPLIHKFYILRRLQQLKGRIDQGDQEKVISFWDIAQTKISDFDERFGDIVSFIIKCTPVSPPPTDKGRRR